MNSDKDEQEKSKNSLPHRSNFFQPIGLRRSFRSGDEVDRVFLDYGYYFLLPLGTVLWALLVNFIF
jgi:hypothetical protein